MIEDFKKAISEVWKRDGKNTWPVDLNAVTSLFMDIFFEELITDIHQLQETGLDNKTIASMLNTHARIIRLIMPCVQGMKTRGTPIDKTREYVKFLLSLAQHLKYGDLCSRDEKNAIKSPDDLDRIIDNSTLTPADKNNSIIVLKLCGILWAYTEVVFFKTHGLYREFHGPYSYRDFDQEFLIRDFTCLNPVDLWTDCQTVKYGKLRVITAYDNLGLKIDIYNNLFIKPGSSYLKGLRYFAVEGDGKVLNLDEIKELSTVLSKLITAIGSHIEKLDWRSLAEKYAMIFWFSKKALREALRLEWQFPQIVRKRIESGELDTRFQNLSQRDLQRLLRFSF